MLIFRKKIFIFYWNSKKKYKYYINITYNAYVSVDFII